MVYTEFDRLRTGSDANCKKGMPCGNSCISKLKKCRKGLGADVAAVVDHVTDPPNLEQGAGSSEVTQGAPPDEYDEWKFEQDFDPDDPDDRTFAERLNPDAPPPTKDQAEAINAYTGLMYSDVNGLLRTGKLKDDSEYTQLDVQGVIDKASEGMSSLPDYKGETYRGTILNDDIVARMKVGGTYSDKGFLSTTTDKDMAYGYHAGFDPPKGRTQVSFTINGKHGKDISQASQVEDEKEVLFNPSSKFRIASMEMKDDVLHVGMNQYGKQK